MHIRNKVVVVYSLTLNGYYSHYMLTYRTLSFIYLLSPIWINFLQFFFFLRKIGTLITDDSGSDIMMITKRTYIRIESQYCSMLEL